MATVATDKLLQGVPIGVVPPAPKGSLRPSVLVSIMGPYPFPYGGKNRTTLDDTLAMCRYSTAIDAVPVFIPDMVTASDREKMKESYTHALRPFTAMRNWSMDMCIEHGYDYVLHLENDAKMAEDALVRLMASAWRGIVIPRLTYPTFPPIELLCWGPRIEPERSGMLQLDWSAHTAMLISRDAILEFTDGPMFKQYNREGQDHTWWQRHKVFAYMDLDTPCEVLEVPHGHSGVLQVSFYPHERKGKDGGAEDCPGVPYEHRRFKNYVEYQCHDCGYQLEFKSPTPVGAQLAEDSESLPAGFRAKKRYIGKFVDAKAYLEVIPRGEVVPT